MAGLTIDIKNFAIFKKLVSLLKEITVDPRIDPKVSQEYVDKLTIIMEEDVENDG